MWLYFSLVKNKLSDILGLEVVPLAPGGFDFSKLQGISHLWAAANLLKLVERWVILFPSIDSLLRKVKYYLSLWLSNIKTHSSSKQIVLNATTLASGTDFNFIFFGRTVLLCWFWLPWRRLQAYNNRRKVAFDLYLSASVVKSLLSPIKGRSRRSIRIHWII